MTAESNLKFRGSSSVHRPKIITCLVINIEELRNHYDYVWNRSGTKYTHTRMAILHFSRNYTSYSHRCEV